MIIENYEQGSDEWFQARLGIPTASEFGKILTATGKKSTQASAYMNKLLAEYMIGPLEGIEKTEWMERGNLLEAEARELYEFENNCEVSQVGIVYKDDKRLISCSPDGLIDSAKKGLEIKCPSPAVHVEYLMAGKAPAKYIPQIQGSMWVTGWDEWDFMSYHPDMPALTVTVKRDPKWHQAFTLASTAFIEEMLEKRNQLDNLRSQS